MKARTQAYSQRHLISVAEIANAVAIARGTDGHKELREMAERVSSGELTTQPLYPPHQPWQHSGDLSRLGVPAGDPAGIWRMLLKKASKSHQSDKDAFSHPPAASTWHMLAADVYELARQPVWSAIAAAALRDLACRYSPELTGEVAAQQPEPAAVEASPVQPQAAAPAPVMTDSASNMPGNGRVWTPEKLAEVQAYRDAHGTKAAAEHFKVSEQLIRRKLPSKKPTPKGYSAFTHWPK